MSFCEMPPKPGSLNLSCIGFLRILTFCSAIARRRCWTAASSEASISPFLTSPVLVFPSQVQTGSFCWAGWALAAAAGEAIVSSPYGRGVIEGRVAVGRVPEESRLRSSSGSELRASASSIVTRPRCTIAASDWLKVCMPNFDWPTCIAE